MDPLTRDAFLAFNDTIIERVDIPEMNGYFHVKSLTEKDRVRWQRSNHLRDKKGAITGIKLEGMRERLLVLTVCDETGRALLSEGDVEALGTRNPRIIDRLYSVAERINALTPEEQEEIAKNSSASGENGLN